MPTAQLKVLKLSEIVIDRSAQVRKKGENPKHVAHLRARYEGGKAVECPHVWVVDGVYKAADFHRPAAAAAAGLTELECEVYEGTEVEWRRAAVRNNRDNNNRLPLSDEDRENAVLMYYATCPPNQSASSIADEVGVSESYVSKLLEEKFPARLGMTTRTRGDGKVVPVTSKKGVDTGGSKGRKAGGGGESEAQSDCATGGAGRVVDMGGGNTVTTHPDGKGGMTVIPPSGPPVDEWGIPVQPHAAEAFAAVGKFEELVRHLKAAQRLFNEVANEPGGTFLTLSDVSRYKRATRGGEAVDRYIHDGIETALRQVKAAEPAHTVCPYEYADGGHPDDCPTCKGQRWTPALGKNTPPVLAERAKAAFGVA